MYSNRTRKHTRQKSLKKRLVGGVIVITDSRQKNNIDRKTSLAPTVNINFIDKSVISFKLMFPAVILSTKSKMLKVSISKGINSWF